MNIKEELYKPLPSEALKPHPSKSYLTTIKPIYVTDRLNDVFGLEGWTNEVEVVSIKEIGKRWWVVAKVTLICGKIRREQYGGNDNQDFGDAFKGAVTDGLTKCASYIGVGADVYKGKTKTPKNNSVFDDLQYEDGHLNSISQEVK